MLEEHEWKEFFPIYEASMVSAKQYVLEHKTRSGLEFVFQPALDKWFEMTGFRETNINAVWHHRASAYGPPCGGCGKPLRTPEARFCAECGWKPG